MFRAMRRIKQQLPENEVIEILQRNAEGVLSLHGDNGYPYGVPVNYVWDNGRIIFHGALTGHKADAMKANDKVCFTVVDLHEVLPQKLATSFRSVIVFGKVHFIEDPAEKERAARLFANKHSGDYPEEIEAEIAGVLGRTLMVEIIAEHITGKESLDLMEARNRASGQDPA